MDNNVIVTVTGRGELSDEAPIITRAPGKYYINNDKHYVIYELPDEDRPSCVIRHMLIFREHSLEMTKSAGEYRTRIMYDIGKCNLTEYNTPQGKLLLGFKTEAFSFEMTDNGLRAELRYTIMMGDEPLSKNVLEVEVQPI